MKCRILIRELFGILLPYNKELHLPDVSTFMSRAVLLHARWKNQVIVVEMLKAVSSPGCFSTIIIRSKRGVPVSHV